jgi:hypothetical protein
MGARVGCGPNQLFLLFLLDLITEQAHRAGRSGRQTPVDASQLEAEVGISVLLREAVEGPRMVIPDGCPVALI